MFMRSDVKVRNKFLAATSLNEKYWSAHLINLYRCARASFSPGVAR
jgi:hypothetical protein